MQKLTLVLVIAIFATATFAVNDKAKRKYADPMKTYAKAKKKTTDTVYTL